MKAMYRFLFPVELNPRAVSWLLLALRLFFGFLFLMHGFQKWSNFETLSASFPDPLGVGSNVSLGLAIFGEVICSLGFILGFLFRIVLLPMIFTMLMAFFVIHRGGAFLIERELPLIYLILFILLYMTGPGKFSLDKLIGKYLLKRKHSSIEEGIII